MSDVSSAAADLGLPVPGGGDASQPEMSVSAAWARRAELMRDPAFRERVEANEPNARAEMMRIGRGIASGISFDLGSGVDRNAFGPDVAASLDQRDTLVREEMIDHIRQRADIPEAVAEQVRKNVPVTAHEHRLAVEERRRLLADQGWVQKYLSGDRACRTQMALCEIILSSRVVEQGSP